MELLDRAWNVCALLTFVVVSALTVSANPSRTNHYALVSSTGLNSHDVVAEPATLQGKSGLRLTIVDDGVRRPQPSGGKYFAAIENVQFTDGVIEAEIAGSPAPGAPEDARGFVGIAFRLQDDLKTYDAFYLRMTNGRAEDQERRNHSAQYVSHPEWPWFRLRNETPGKYEAYVDLVPDSWTKIRIEVRGDRARLYVQNQEQPTLIVNDLKSGTGGKGGSIALWIDKGTVGYFRDLTIGSASNEFLEIH